ncbi:baseplate assembly protein [Marinomonas ostreistagni]|uniref:Baseplate J/gp47 family protein n=1 Tax=Marinomonas ostreistagni TaxID=359209 RepID=A0ABS0ZAR1_9GAMM|nr:baseplate J/gp47 family protein [Marinomonas ostreistagni]MBJ7550739.1 baseplate J/gp47 family protein [Marinomonas ostreistagni]
MSLDAIDFTQLPAPHVVRALDFQTIFDEIKADFLARDETYENLAESDPAWVLLEVAAYREFTIRQQINDDARAVMLPYAVGADLDNLAANFNIERAVVVEADLEARPIVEEVLESDDSLRRRTQLAFETAAVAGPINEYIAHALNASGEIKSVSVDVPRFDYVAIPAEAAPYLPAGIIALVPTYDAGLTDPQPGDVALTLLAHTGTGEVDQTLCDEIEATLDDKTPVTDSVFVRSAQIVEFDVSATLYCYADLGAEEAIANATAALNAYVSGAHRLGYDITLSGIYAALHQTGVQRVELHAPTANIIIGKRQAAYCTGIDLQYGGVAE